MRGFRSPECRRHQVHAHENDATAKHRYTHLSRLEALAGRVEEVAECDHAQTHLCDLEDDEKAYESRADASPQQDSHAIVERNKIRAGRDACHKRVTSASCHSSKEVKRVCLLRGE